MTLLATLVATGITSIAVADKGTVATDDAQAFVSFFDQFTGIVDANQNDCAAMAKKLDALLKANADMLARGRAATAAGKQLPAAAQAHITESSKKLGVGAQKCGANPQVAAALQTLQPH